MEDKKPEGKFLSEYINESSLTEPKGVRDIPDHFYPHIERMLRIYAAQQSEIKDNLLNAYGFLIKTDVRVETVYNDVNSPVLINYSAMAELKHLQELKLSTLRKTITELEEQLNKSV